MHPAVDLPYQVGIALGNVHPFPPRYFQNLDLGDRLAATTVDEPIRSKRLHGRNRVPEHAFIVMHKFRTLHEILLGRQLLQ